MSALALPATVPAERLVALNAAPLDPSRAVVVYWPVMARRTRYNFGLEHAIGVARTLGRPLVVLDALRVAYPWASDRLHRFALDGMRDTAAAYRAAGVTHLPYVEPEAGAGHGLLEALAGRACLVVSDDYPEFFVPRMLAAAARRLEALGTRLEAVDSNGLLPLRAGLKAWTSAPHFRRHLQRHLPGQLEWRPAADPLRAARDLPRPDDATARWLAALRDRWPAPSPALLGDDPAAAARALARLPIDHEVPPVAEARGGEVAGQRVLAAFVADRLDRYGADRNAVDDPANSRLSPYLHWGYVSVHEVFAAIAEREQWTPARLAPRPTARREGWWGMSPDAERFLDEIVAWRELSFNTAHWMEAHDTYASLPAWALATLDAHRADARPALYDRDALEVGATYDTLWNATQGQLRADGRIHNYLRMLWGKKVMEWTREPEEAFAHLLHLNNRWALDGRDPNSTGGIAWVFGRYDHAWQERAVIGKVRPMSSAATARKIRVGAYVARYGAMLPGGGATTQLDAFTAG